MQAQRPASPAPVNMYSAPVAGMYSAPVADAPPYPPGAARAAYPGAPGPLAGGNGTGPDGAGPPRRTGRVLLAAGGALVIVVAGVVVGLTLTQPAQNASDTGGTHASHSSHPAGSSTASLPTGYTWYSQPASATSTNAGFRLAAPQGWTTTRTGLTTYLRAPSGPGFFEVDLTNQTFPKPMTEARWLEHKTRSQGKFPGYRRISLRPVQVAGSSGAVWSFSWAEHGVGRVVVQDYLFDLSTSGGIQSYALYASSPAAAWSQDAQTATEAISTFQPAG